MCGSQPLKKTEEVDIVWNVKASYYEKQSFFFDGRAGRKKISNLPISTL